MKPRAHFPAHTRALLLFVGALTLFVLIVVRPLDFLPRDWPKVIEHVMGTLTVVSFVHLLDRLWLGRDLAETFERIGSDIHADIEVTKQKLEAHAEGFKGELQHAADRILADTNVRLDKYFSLLADCHSNDLIAILPPRQDEELGARTHDAIRRAIGNSSEVELTGVSLLDFFGRPQGAASQYGRYYRHLCELLRADGQPTACTTPLKSLQVLLLEPTSEAVKFREKIETSMGLTPNIAGEIESAISSIHKLNDMPEHKVKIQYQLYGITPQMWCVRTDDCVFIELYHSAETGPFCDCLRRNGRLGSSQMAPCTGGRVPVFQFRRDSNTYIAAKFHFATLWDRLGRGADGNRVRCEVLPVNVRR